MVTETVFFKADLSKFGHYEPMINGMMLRHLAVNEEEAVLQREISLAIEELRALMRRPLLQDGCSLGKKPLAKGQDGYGHNRNQENRSQGTEEKTECDDF